MQTYISQHFVLLLGCLAALLLFGAAAASGAISIVDYANSVQTPQKKAVVRKITNESIFLKDLKFIPVNGLVGYKYNREESLGGIAFRGLNETYTADTGVYNPQIESLAILGGSVQTDRQIVLNPGGTEIRASRVLAKTRKAGLFYDKYVIDGDPAVNAKQFYGFNARLASGQVVTAGANGAALTLSMLDTAIDLVVGTSNSEKRIVCNKAIRRKITALVLAAAGGAAVLDVGKQLTEYNGTPIFVIDEDGDEAAILGFDETVGSSAVCTSLYVYRPGSDTDGEYVQGLVGSAMIDHVDYGERNGVFDDLIEANMGLAVFHPRAVARIKGITNA